MFKQTALNSVLIGSYRNLFSPPVRKTCDFVQNSMGYHSEVFAVTRYRIFLRKKQHKMENRTIKTIENSWPQRPGVFPDLMTPVKETK